MGNRSTWPVPFVVNVTVIVTSCRSKKIKRSIPTCEGQIQSHNGLQSLHIKHGCPPSSPPAGDFPAVASLRKLHYTFSENHILALEGAFLDASLKALRQLKYIAKYPYNGNGHGSSKRLEGRGSHLTDT